MDLARLQRAAPRRRAHPGRSLRARLREPLRRGASPGLARAGGAAAAAVRRLRDEPVAAQALNPPDGAGSGRRAVAVANGAHVLHDGLSDLLYVFFPIWQAALGLDYASIGVLKACYSGGMASFQLAATRLAGRIGHGPVLAAGTALAGAGFVAAAHAGGFAGLAAALLIAGAGAAAQHPLGSDIVARMTPPARRRQALGLYNTVGASGRSCFRHLPPARCWSCRRRSCSTGSAPSPSSPACSSSPLCRRSRRRGPPPASPPPATRPPRPPPCSASPALRSCSGSA